MQLIEKECLNLPQSILTLNIKLTPFADTSCMKQAEHWLCYDIFWIWSWFNR